jgi:hypothetical protein
MTNPPVEPIAPEPRVIREDRRHESVLHRATWVDVAEHVGKKVFFGIMLFGLVIAVYSAIKSDYNTYIAPQEVLAEEAIELTATPLTDPVSDSWREFVTQAELEPYTDILVQFALIFAAMDEEYGHALERIESLESLEARIVELENAVERR